MQIKILVVNSKKDLNMLSELTKRRYEIPERRKKKRVTSRFSGDDLMIRKDLESVFS